MEITVNDNNFKKEVIEKSKTLPVLVDFFAVWCPPCVKLGPIVKEVAGEMEGKIVVAKADTANCPKLCMDYEIQNIPALKIFRNGKVIAENPGFIPKEELISWINESI
jgi:thioredoxin-like negative regulator of GroEL